MYTPRLSTKPPTCQWAFPRDHRRSTDYVSRLPAHYANDQTYSLHHDTSDLVGVGVGGGSSVLKVSVALVRTLPWNSDRSTTVGDTVREAIDAAGLVAAGQTESVVLTVHGNVLLVASLKLLDSSLDVLHAALNTHLLAGEVAVHTGTVPVTGDWLGVEGDLGAEFFGDTVEQETGHPEVVTHCEEY